MSLVGIVVIVAVVLVCAVIAYVQGRDWTLEDDDRIESPLWSYRRNDKR